MTLEFKLAHDISVKTVTATLIFDVSVFEDTVSEK